jgi:AraC-like DNA-binding protein/CheY-like chemotaxis protein
MWKPSISGWGMRMTTSFDSQRRETLFTLSTYAYHFVHAVLPFRSESRCVLEAFVNDVAHLRLPNADLQMILLQCLVALQPSSGGRLPSLVDRYLSLSHDLLDCLGRFYRCLHDLLRYRGIGSPKVQEAIAFIEDEFRQHDFTETSVARRLEMTEAELSGAFHVETGLTFGSYLRGVRLDRAAVCLLTTSIKSMKEIWVGVGYNHRSNFNHDFRNRFGMSPRKYRARGLRVAAEETYRNTRAAIFSPKVAGPLATVLIVDDDKSSRETTARWLRLAGYTVILAADGAEGLREVENRSPHVILLDLHLGPKSMDGIDVLRELRAMRNGVSAAVALFTADPFADEFADEAHRLNAVVIWKLRPPEDIEILVACLEA